MVRRRRDIEAMEAAYLAPYAMKSCESDGRLYPEPDHPLRTCYQRDRDRIVHCEAFRKLEYKTQVFVIFESDYFRTRLTHTLEVAQIGRTIGRALRLNEDLIEAIALAHDLGHPPFGHAGEQALNDLMKAAGFSGFNHNLHSFRIVTEFERRYPDFPGLNLSVEVLVGILKHRTLYDVPAYAEGLLAQGPTLEAQVVDVADSLAYLNHDIDDGLASGCITAEDLCENELWRSATESVRRRMGEQSGPLWRYQVVKELIDRQIQDLVHSTAAALARAGVATTAEVKRRKKSLVRFSEAMRRQRDHLQTILEKRLYRHWRVVRMTAKAKRIIKDLFEAYISEPEQLPYEVYQRGRRIDKKEKYFIICHYIAQMTDRYAMEEHRRLFNPYAKV